MNASEHDQNADDLNILLRRGLTPHRVALEDFVAYEWEAGSNVLGTRNSAKRDSVALRWLTEAVQHGQDQKSALDIGCAYGIHLFRLNAMLGKPQHIDMVGVDLFPDAIRWANAFATTIPGFANCRFQIADLSSGLPFEADSFDAVNFCDVLEHMVDPEAALKEIARITKPGGALVVSTPLRDSIFKRIAERGNRALGGRLYRLYYSGKGAALDESGRPIMWTAVGHDHVSEMTLPELKALCGETGWAIEDIELMPIMSGSRWFDRHAVLLAALVLLEGLHEKLRRPGWAHSVMLRLRKI